MNDGQRFKAGMRDLGLAYNREITEPLAALYWRSLAHLTDDEFADAVGLYLTQPGERFWPAPGALLAFVRPDPALDAEAVRAFDLIEGLAVYNPVVGARWSERVVRERLGYAAGEAFVAAGGESAWQERNEKNWPFTRKAFVAAYIPARKVILRDEKLALISGVDRQKALKP